MGSVNLVKVALNAFAHDFPSDVEMLLVTPDGRKMVLMGKARWNCGHKPDREIR